MPRSAPLVLLLALFPAGVGCVPPPAAPTPPAAAPKPKAPPEQNPVVAREPDVGPRVDARTGSVELAGVRVRVVQVWVSRGHDDGIVRLKFKPPEEWMKVRLEFEYLTKEHEATFYWWNHTTAAASAVYDAANRRYAGVESLNYTKEDCKIMLAQGKTRPKRETIYFQGPPKGSSHYALDLVPDHLPPGQKYQFLIPAEMIEWRKGEEVPR